MKIRFSGLLFVCILHLMGFRGGWLSQLLAGRDPGTVQTGEGEDKAGPQGPSVF